MRQDLDKVIIRLPDGLRDQIKANAAANGRSMNAEVVSRLQGAGKTLRDEFALAVLAGMMARPGVPFLPEGSAEVAYRYADEMLAARTEALK